MQWFGESWGARLNADCPQADVPFGSPCVWCHELFEEDDQGIVYANGPAAHVDCFLRQTIGGLNHVLGRCSCCGGTEPPDPPDMSKREAATAAVEAYRRQGGG